MMNKRAPGQTLPQYLYWQFKKRFLDGYSRKSYSQEGEDLLLYRIFEKKRNGFYVDVGAHHPKRFSNTFLFYKRGWNGINIDAMPGSMKLFNQLRPRDINIECAVTTREESLTYFIFKDPALNGISSTFSKDRLLRAESENAHKVILQGKPLNQILQTFLPEEQNIDFLSVDAEGHDFIVLQSIDLNQYKPSYILVEILYTDFSDIDKDPVYIHLLNNGYSLFAKLVKTCVFKRNI